MKKKLISMLIIIFICGVLDYILTYIGQNIYQVIQEVNPFMISIIKDMPFTMGVTLRILIFAFISLSLSIWYAAQRKPHKAINRVVMGYMIFELIIIAYHMTWIIRV